MTTVKVVAECGKWRIHTTAGYTIGPRLWGAVPANGLPPLTDIFDTKQEAQDAAFLWNEYAKWVEHHKKKGKRRY
jgi:hypothetical protein